MIEKDFDKLLHTALTPKISEERLFSFKEKKLSEEEAFKMKAGKIIKPVVAVAACTAIILGVSRIPDLKEVREAAKGAKTNVVEDMGNMFTISAKAASGKKKLEKNKAVVISTDDAVYGSAWMADDQTKEVSYSIAAPLFCEGKNIERITYALSKGAFQISMPKGEDFILEGKETKSYDLPMLILEKGKRYKEEEKGFILGKEKDAKEEEEKKDDQVEYQQKYHSSYTVEYQQKYYSSYTVSAENQLPEGCYVDICNSETLSGDLYDKLWDYNNVQRVKEGRDELYKNLILTCEVTYKDGSKEAVEVEIGNQILTMKEAGLTDYDSMTKSEEDKKSSGLPGLDDRKEVFTTYKMRG